MPTLGQGVKSALEKSQEHDLATEISQKHITSLETTSEQPITIQGIVNFPCRFNYFIPQ